MNYYPFGMLMPGRNQSSESYRYGFNGMERDDEVKGSGNSYTTEFRQYDSRLGRWLSLDPIVQPWQSPYCAFDNNPIYFADPTGLVAENAGGGDPPADEPGRLGKFLNAIGGLAKAAWNGLMNGNFKNAVSDWWDDNEEYVEELGEFVVEVAQENGANRVKVDKPITQSEKDNLELFHRVRHYDILHEDTFNEIIGDIIFNPWYSGKEYDYSFLVGDDGYIDLRLPRPPIYDVQYAGVGSGAFKIFKFAKDYKKFGEIYAKAVRNSNIFPNDKLRNFLGNYYRKTSYLGRHGSSADILILEVQTGQLFSNVGHLKKVIDTRKGFANALQGSFGQLTQFETQFLIREIIKMDDAIKLAKDSGLFR